MKPAGLVDATDAYHNEALLNPGTPLYTDNFERASRFSLSISQMAGITAGLKDGLERLERLGSKLKYRPTTPNTTAVTTGTPVNLTIGGQQTVRYDVGRLLHYTDEAGAAGIVQSGELLPSLRSINPNDVRYGNGQYLSDILPGTKTPAQLSRSFINNPFQGQRFTHFVEIDTFGLRVIEGRSGVFVVPNNIPLDLSGRILGTGSMVSP